MPRYVYEGRPNGLQIYSVKVAGIEKGGLEWPLHVFGVVAVRDPVDPKHNLIFNRRRDRLLSNPHKRGLCLFPYSSFIVLIFFFVCVAHPTSVMLCTLLLNASMFITLFAKLYLLNTVTCRIHIWY